MHTIPLRIVSVKMTFINGLKLKKFRQFLILGSCSQILESASLQIVTEQRKSQEFLLLIFEMVEVLEGSC